jgi:predicted DNA-binding transcriptional regulator YafY
LSTTLERLDRVLAMVPWLLAHPGARIDDVAQRFDATPDQIAADLDVLGFCGVPGYGGGDLMDVSLVGDRVVVRMADYFRRPLRLGLREAMTLLLAGRALLDAPGIGNRDALRRAVAKLEDALGAAEVAVDLGPADENLLSTLGAAVTDRRVLRIRYRSTGKEEETSREVEPWGLVASDGAWYLRGHCRRADAPREFRVDRIREFETTGEVSSPPPTPPAASGAGYRPEGDTFDVVLAIDDSATWLAGAVPGATMESPDEVRLPARSLEWAARLVLSLGGAARVVEPAALADRVRELARATADRYEQDGRVP